MISRIFVSAIVAGVVAGLIAAIVGHFTMTPLILEAERYENAGEVHSSAPAELAIQNAAYRVILTHSDAPAGEKKAWAPQDGLERTLFTGVTTILIAIGYALALIGMMVIKGTGIDAQRGLLWGIAGFAAVALSPALGLPPELPGSATAGVAARQIWWFGCIVATACGIGWLAFTDRVHWWLVGILFLILPHAIGAPQAAAYTSHVPSEITGQFVAASLASAAIFWVVLGWTSGAVFDRLGQQTSEA